MKLLLALIPALLLAQTPPVSILVMPDGGAAADGARWDLVLVGPRAKIVITSVKCYQLAGTVPDLIKPALDIAPGETISCISTLSAPTLTAGFPLRVVPPYGLTGPGLVTVPAGASTATFTISYPIPAAALDPLPVWPTVEHMCGPVRCSTTLVAFAVPGRTPERL
jgi:hypothetical protein